jgi:hypothetical protein
VTIPHERVAFGAHAFPFSGFHADGKDRPALPLLPVRLRKPGGAWSRPLNAILDTGSTKTVFPAGVDALLGVERPQEKHRIGGLGRGAEAVSITVDIAIVDASFPSIPCWEFSDLPVEMVLVDDDLEHPVLGWDLLFAFEMVLNSEESRIELRPTRALLQGNKRRADR